METIKLENAKPTTEAGVVERSVNILLKEEDYKAIQDTKQDFGKILNYMLEQYAKGAILIPFTRVQYLSDLVKAPLTSSEDILEVIENGVRRSTPSGTLRVYYDLDPAYAIPIEEVAHAQGRTVDQIVHECLSLVLNNSWAYALNCTGGTINFTTESRDELERVMCKSPITGQDILEWATKAADELGRKRAVKVTPKKENKQAEAGS